MLLARFHAEASDARFLTEEMIDTLEGIGNWGTGTGLVDVGVHYTSKERTYRPGRSIRQPTTIRRGQIVRIPLRLPVVRSRYFLGLLVIGHPPLDRRPCIVIRSLQGLLPPLLQEADPPLVLGIYPTHALMVFVIKPR